jgi:hypothetical protein
MQNISSNAYRCTDKAKLSEMLLFFSFFPQRRISQEVRSSSYHLSSLIEKIHGCREARGVG